MGIFVLSAFTTTIAVQNTSEDIVAQWAVKYSNKQADYEKIRTLQPLQREIQLLKEIATAPELLKWLNDPSSAQFKKDLFQLLEKCRLSLKEKNYFLAVLSNGHYYYNNEKNEYLGGKPLYQLHPDSSKDAWFYDLVDQNRDLHININPDPKLNATKLWIDILIRDENGNILGIIGTGLTLDSFIDYSVGANETGVESFFINHAGAIQLHQDLSFIDFSSVSKRVEDHKTIELLFERPQDLAAIYHTTQRIVSDELGTQTLIVDVQGRETILGLTYISELDWFQFTLIDLDTVLPNSSFFNLGLAHVITIFVAFILIINILNHWILNPIAEILSAMNRVEKGQSIEDFQHIGVGEMAQLSSHFLNMSDKVLESRRDLEEKVRVRTKALEQAAYMDSLTQLLNRRGMTQRIEEMLKQVDNVGVLWIDLDNFKAINDQFSHIAGDAALTDIAHILSREIGTQGYVARWGGDEFLTIVENTDTKSLQALGETICQAVNQHQNCDFSYQLSVSIGAYITTPNESITDLLNHCDQALYQAKGLGKNQCFLSSIDHQ